MRVFLFIIILATLDLNAQAQFIDVTNSNRNDLPALLLSKVGIQNSEPKEEIIRIWTSWELIEIRRKLSGELEGQLISFAFSIDTAFDDVNRVFFREENLSDETIRNLYALSTDIKKVPTEKMISGWVDYLDADGFNSD